MIETGSERTGAANSPVLKAMRLLSEVARSDVAVTLADLSRALDLPKPTSLRLARALESVGFVHKDPLTGRYAIGRGFEDIALCALRNSAGHDTRRLIMDELAARIGARVNFVVLKAGRVLHVEWVEFDLADPRRH